MSFLTPFYIAGVLAVGLPILFHMIRRMPKDRRPFSSVMFLEESPPRVRSWNRLSDWLLFLLRAAAVILLALAFARPFFFEAHDAQVRPPGKRCLVLIDTSASMRRDGLWQQALETARQRLQEIAPGDDAAVWTFDRDVTPLLTFDEWRAMPEGLRGQEASKRLDTISPGWQETRLDEALVSAAAASSQGTRQTMRSRSQSSSPLHLAAENQTARGGWKGTRQTIRQRSQSSSPFHVAAEGQSARGVWQDRPGDSANADARLLLVTDLQSGSRLDALRGHAWPDGVQVELATVTTNQTTNAGVQLVDDTSTQTGAERESRRVRVVNAADSVRDMFELTWNGVESGQAVSDSVSVWVPAGQSRVVRVDRWPDSAGQTEPLCLTLQGDDHAFDNSAYTHRTPTPRLRVLYVGDEDAADPQQPLYYLKRAFASTDRWTVEVTVHENGETDLETPLPRLTLVTALPGERNAKYLRRLARRGGTVLVALSHDTRGAGLETLVGDQIPIREADVDGYTMLADIDFQHPIFAPFDDPRFSDFTKVRFWRHRRVDVGELHDCRVLARFADGDPAVIEIPRGEGRLLLFAFGWHPADSQIARSTKFVPLLHGILEDSTGWSHGPSRYEVGASVALTELDFSNRGTSHDGRPLQLRQPDGSTVRLAADQQEIANLVLPGVYTVEAAGQSNHFSVNVPPDETRTAPMSPDELTAVGVPLDPAADSTSQADGTQTSAGQRQLLAHELESRQKYWRWLLAAALTVLVLETWAARPAVSQP